MKMKKIGFFVLLAVFAATVFLTNHILTPKASAIEPFWPFTDCETDCLIYAGHHCPLNVRELCYNDCREFNCAETPQE